MAISIRFGHVTIKTQERLTRRVYWLRYTHVKAAQRSYKNHVALLCYDRKGRAVSAQIFTLWQQATIEITWRDHSIIAFRATCIWVLFFAHIPFMLNRTFNATPTDNLRQLRLCLVPSWCGVSRTIRGGWNSWSIDSPIADPATLAR